MWRANKMKMVHLEDEIEHCSSSECRDVLE
jgi:hypothetical protein